MKKIVFIIFLVFSLNLFAGILFDDTISLKMQKNIIKKLKKRKIKSNFLLEFHQATNSFLLISNRGFSKKIKAKNITADDILNIMETMDETINRIKITKTVSKQKTVKPKEKKVVKCSKVAKKTIFSFPSSYNKIFIGYSLLTEEKGGIGIELSKGVMFLRFGLNFKYGFDFELKDDTTIKWFAFGILAQMDIYKIMGIVFSTGLETSYYVVNEKFFLREHIFTSFSYRKYFIVPEIRLKVSPQDITFKFAKTKYRTTLFVGMFVLNFAF